ncbi:bifunctional anthranilate synthase component I family protein/class IV aminotransferase [Pelomonas aquatica]|uniref:bifunctional anthranilate synthase component I family protein/class IV aminotransferase n=1 Tax=Pelomonas aquatica TaxID=431058 RepID=UPI00227D478E|nr:bifunctional anthranilate synthase component I family protein/class IV aminotransferase [Pelomonas aquatica]MCY4755084.1 bifunctional anthranilate synthase component I family protein/class IV aminotransferase [Pelomonas aquatica]
MSAVSGGRAPLTGRVLHAAFDFPRHPLAREDGERVRGCWSAPPARWLRATRLDEVRAVIDQAEAAARAGAWVLGGLRYEAASAFDAVLATRVATAPLAEFAVYERAPEPWPELPRAYTGLLGWHDTEPDASAAIERIRDYIRAGDCYQVNLTTRLHAATAELDAEQLFLALHASQPGGFSLFLREAGAASVSPELFFDWRPVPGAKASWLLAAQPMKGTAPRGRDRVDDEAAQQHLRTSEKERAENLMIVDLLRNDLSRVAQLGTVRVPRLFELHALPTVWQMTSTVTAVSRAGLTLADAFAALFPCGSVTGAPKVRAMQIIRELEATARGWYCGALGLIQPGGVATFNVPIRTVEFRDGGLVCGLGSAITLDSEPAAEIAEWRAKSRFLARAEAPVEALETLRLEAGVAVRAEAHLARMQRTARHFGLRFSAAEARACLGAVAAGQPDGSWRLRLSCDADGRLSHTLAAFTPTPVPVRLALADKPIATRGPGAEFLAHKTTRREAYAGFDKPAGAFDVMLWNEAGELTECSFGNLAVQIDGRWLTPPLAAGLLPGVLRAELLAQGRIHEARLTRDDLARASALAFFNSLRGWLPATLALA